jgi:dCTP deaminase
MGLLSDWQIKEHVKITPFAEGEKRPGIISFGLSSHGYDARIGPVFKVFSNVFCGIVDPKNFDPNSFATIDCTPVPHVWRKNPQQTARDPQNPICDECKTTAMDVAVGNGPMFCFEPQPFVMIPPNSFALGSTVEHFVIPRDCLAICVGKSTYARCGIVVNTTPLEPEWEGHVTVEISNTTPLPAKIYANEGIMQVIFLRTDGVGEALLNAVRRIVSSDRPHPFDTTERRIIEEHLHADLGLSTCRKSYKDKAGKYMHQKDEIVTPRID